MGLLLKHRGGPGFGAGRLTSDRDIDLFESLSKVLVQVLKEEGVAPAAAVGTLAGRGPLQLAFLDHETGSLVLAPLSDEAALFVVTSPACDRAGLVSDLRRHRLHLAALA